MTDVATGLTVLAGHLTASGAALTRPILNVSRGFATGPGLWYYWSGEIDPTTIMGARNTLTSEMVGERFEIAALWAITNVGADLIAIYDADMQTLAGQVRTRIDGDSQLGGNVADLLLGDATPDVVVISNVRYLAVRWTLDLAYVEYTVAQ